MLTTSLLFGLPTAFAICAAAAYFAPERTPRHPATASYINPPADDSSIDTTRWVTGWPHEAPDQPFTRLQAHKAMQQHRLCPIDRCRRKAAAWDALVELGAIKPSKQ